MSLEWRVARALDADHFVSGQALAARFEVSRAAVWKCVGRLVDKGLAIEAQAGRGYRLAAPVEWLDETALRARLPALVLERLEVLEVVEVVDSTNSRVLGRAGGRARFLACLAEFQSAGRGRRGRAWLVAPGAGVCLSVGGTLPLPPAALAGLPLAVGTAVANALGDLGVPEIRLKWPNDIVWAGRKLGGVLIELRGESEGPSQLAVGIGLNQRLSARASEAIAAAGGLPAGDLAEACGGEPPSRTAVAAAVLESVVTTLDRFQSTGLEPFLDDWRRLDALHGVEVVAAGDGHSLSGIARGVDRLGALLIEDPDGRLRRVVGGEVSVRAAS